MSTGPVVVFLHALPLDGTMWDRQRAAVPLHSHAPDLYQLGDSIEAWSAAVLEAVDGDRLVLVGCSVGGSCALEMAAQAPERIAAMVLIGTKAAHRPDPEQRDTVLAALSHEGMAGAWPAIWAPLISPTATHARTRGAQIALRQSAADVARGVRAFHSRPSRETLLSDLAMPVIFVTGTEGRLPGTGVTLAQAASVPQGRARVIEASGHYVPLEQPDTLNGLLCDVVAAI